MSYYRPIRIDELTPWLADYIAKNNLINDDQIDAAALATAILDKYDVLGHSKTAT